MADLTDAAIDAALARGSIARAIEPRAAKARFDRRRGRIVVDLTNGCIFAFPPRLAQGLETATDDDLDSVEILGNGYGLHWGKARCSPFNPRAARRYINRARNVGDN